MPIFLHFIFERLSTYLPVYIVIVLLLSHTGINLIADDNIGTKCNSLTQQFIRISTTIDTWAACFDSIESSSGPQRLQIQLLQGGQVHCVIPQCSHNSIVTIQNHIWYLIIILANITTIYSFW